MSDDELSTTRQWSDASSGEEQDITCCFTNALTGETYFTKQLNKDNWTSVGFIVNLVKSELRHSAVHLKVGEQVCDDVYKRFWQCPSVQDALGAAEDKVLTVQVIKVTREEDEESMPALIPVV